MSEKAIYEKDVLRDEFPDARQLLCQWHALTWLNKLVTRLAPGVKEDAKSLMRDLVYAKSSAAYEELKATLPRLLGDNSSHKLYKTFVDNWDLFQDEWVTYKRGDVPHLTNNTNNRIESQWGKLRTLSRTLTPLTSFFQR
ncbi:hypothetical protein F443_00646 [Phytophthora nicotianae P1569]|uniref:MULE transposase domain-containing protein n=1 Tax=Phytophthora nicotianae P1569 TaxID=1317065 RepID=V9G2I5_PHYNI|nr:hypothetical protein F443_00646 [Phytophthora nicotianae P1569]